MPKILVLILSCKATIDRQEACLETWLRHVPPEVEFKFVVGRPGIGSSICGHTLYCDCPDTYLGLPIKVWQMCKESLVRFDYDWLFKCDDDTFVNLYRVLHYPKSIPYMGRRIILSPGASNWHTTVVPNKELTSKIDYPTMQRMHELANLPSANGQWTSWASGMGYFLSRDAVKLIAAEPLLHVDKELYEDKMVGSIMAGHGIYLHGQHQTLRYRGENLMGATAIHPCSPSQMRETYWRLLRAGEMET